MNALFENYHIDFVENIENPFAALANIKMISQFFGINSKLLLDGYCYILIKYRQNNASYRLLDVSPENFKLDARIERGLESVSMEDHKSVLHFISKFGSHYFQSFSIGNVIYQVCGILRSSILINMLTENSYKFFKIAIKYPHIRFYWF